jgi:hypothetical protein
MQGREKDRVRCEVKRILKIGKGKDKSKEDI